MKSRGGEFSTGTTGNFQSELTASLYEKLERVILPLFYGQPDAFARVMGSTKFLNGSFFNTQRMLSPYVSNAYFPKSEQRERAVTICTGKA